MGMNKSVMRGKGLSTTEMLSLVMNTLYKQFVDKEVEKFDAFNVAILDTFNTINMALPGKHYDAPSYKDVKDLFEKWREASNEDCRKKMFSEFMNKKVNLNKVDESMITTAIVAPPAAMMAKKTGQIVPQLKVLNAIPDVVFVPSATILALIAVKILRLKFMLKTTSKDVMESHLQPAESASDTEQHPHHETETDVHPPEHSDQAPQHTHKDKKFCALCNVFH